MMKGAIAAGDCDPAKIAAELKKSPSPFEKDLVEDFSFALFSGPSDRKVALLDAGAANSVVAQLSDLGFERSGSAADIAEVLAAKRAGLLIAGGPGDPRKAKGAAAAVKAALGKVPLLGVDLGNALLAHVLGCKISRMKVGHHGANQSVRDLEAEKCIITTQHHNFVVDGRVKKGVEVTHVNVNDDTVEGIRSREHKARGVQFRLGRNDMGEPSKILKGFLEGRDA
ncbi:MAG: glutamine amidotransferase-related protein [Planctomycetota bacterium]|jgi:carbamoyl-phosphate synthase small subunit